MNDSGGFLTRKQYQILTVLCEGDVRDEQGNFVAIDLDQLLDRVAYQTSKCSMQFSIRILTKRKYVIKGYEKRRGARRVVYTPTDLAKKLMGKSKPSYFESDGLDDIDLPDTDISPFSQFD
jgi:hypothetical protein